MTVWFTRPALSRSGSISACNISNLNKMPHFLLSKYEISQVSVGGKGSAIEIYWKNQRGYGKFIWWARATIISRATVRWIPLKVLNPTPRFKTRAHFLTNLFTQSHFLLKIWLPGIWPWSIFLRTLYTLIIFFPWENLIINKKEKSYKVFYYFILSNIMLI